MDLPKKLIKKLEQLERLDAKQKEISKNIDAIYRISPVGQAPPRFHRECDKLLSIAEKKAPIWNHIRHYIIPGTSETLWQKALKNPGFLVKPYGVETHTTITAKDIREKLLTV